MSIGKPDGAPLVDIGPCVYTWLKRSGVPMEYQQLSADKHGTGNIFVDITTEQVAGERYEALFSLYFFGRNKKLNRFYAGEIEKYLQRNPALDRLESYWSLLFSVKRAPSYQGAKMPGLYMQIKCLYSTLAPVRVTLIDRDNRRLTFGELPFLITDTQVIEPDSEQETVSDTWEGADGERFGGQKRVAYTETYALRCVTNQWENVLALSRFLRPDDFYTVVYTLPDGTTYCRERAYMATGISYNLLQLSRPSGELSVALRFEDPSLYVYAEYDSGESIYQRQAVVRKG